jgi:NADPH2:quinone reductase
MKAIRVLKFGKPEVMHIEQVPDPEPGTDEVLVEVKAAGVNPVDTYIRAGEYTFGQVPYTPGIDAAGIVTEIGGNISNVEVGNRVYLFGSVSGTYAQKTLCYENQVHLLPEIISFAAGAALGVPYTTAYRALFQRAQAKSGEIVLIHGASGGVGIAALQMAKAADMTVIGTAGSDKGCELVSKQGADHVLNHRTKDYLNQISEITDGKGLDIILEMKAQTNLAKDLEIMAMGGRIVVVGCRGTIEINPRLAMIRDVSIIAMITTNATETEMAEIHAAIENGLKNHTLQPVIANELPLEQAPKAHQDIIQADSHGKIVLIP